MSNSQSGKNPDVNLVIDHLDEFVTAITCACSTVADYVTQVPPAGDRD